jgi:IS30 family transposase
MKGAIHQTAVKVYGIIEHNSHEWFEANTMILPPLIEKKKTALLRNRERSTRYTLSELNQARNEVQKAARQCANNCWLQLNIQIASDNGITRGMYEGIKKANGPTVKKCSPLISLDGDIINDKRKQMDRWVEH